MSKSLKSVAQPPRPDAAALRHLAATTDPSIPPAVMPLSTGTEVITMRLSSGLIDELDAAAEAARTTRKVIVTRALAEAGYRVPAHDLDDRTPKRRRRSA